MGRPVERDWLTVPEVAVRLGLSEESVDFLLGKRRLGCQKVGRTGGRYRITEKHLAAYLESCEVEPIDPSRPGRVPVKTARPTKKGKGDRFDGRPAKHFRDGRTFLESP